MKIHRSPRTWHAWYCYIRHAWETWMVNNREYRSIKWWVRTKTIEESDSPMVPMKAVMTLEWVCFIIPISFGKYRAAQKITCGISRRSSLDDKYKTVYFKVTCNEIVSFLYFGKSDFTIKNSINYFYRCIVWKRDILRILKSWNMQVVFRWKSKVDRVKLFLVSIFTPLWCKIKLSTQNEYFDIAETYGGKKLSKPFEKLKRNCLLNWSFFLMQLLIK